MANMGMIVEVYYTETVIYDGSLLSAIVLWLRNHDTIHIIHDVIKILPLFISVKVLNLS
jgi:hypothetical protein